MTTTESYTIHEVIRMIGNGQIQIPIFQRRYVWKKNQVEELFSTVFNDNPFGAVSAVKTTNDYKIFPIRPLFKNFKDRFKLSKDNDGKNYDDNNPLYLILDGQQRLQSFYLGLTSEYEDMKLCFNKIDGSFKFLNEQEFDNQINEYISVEDLYNHFTGNKYDYISVANIYKINDETNEKVKQNIFKFFYHIFYQKHIVMFLAYTSKLSETDDKLKMLELFRQINRGGAILTIADYVISVWQAFNPRMESLFSKLSLLFDNKDFTPVIWGERSKKLWVRIILNCNSYNYYTLSNLSSSNIEREMNHLIQIAQKSDPKFLFDFICVIIKISRILKFTTETYWVYLIRFLYNTKDNSSHQLCGNVAICFIKMFSSAFVDDVNTEIFVYSYLRSSIVGKFGFFYVLNNEESHIFEIIRFEQWSNNHKSELVVERKSIADIIAIGFKNPLRVYRNYKFKFCGEILKKVNLEQVKTEYEKAWVEKEKIIERNATINN